MTVVDSSPAHVFALSWLPVCPLLTMLAGTSGDRTVDTLLATKISPTVLSGILSKATDGLDRRRSSRTTIA
jgi:hypothetical protein